VSNSPQSASSKLKYLFSGVNKGSWRKETPGMNSKLGLLEKSTSPSAKNKTMVALLSKKKSHRNFQGEDLSNFFTKKSKMDSSQGSQRKVDISELLNQNMRKYVANIGSRNSSQASVERSGSSRIKKESFTPLARRVNRIVIIPKDTKRDLERTKQSMDRQDKASSPRMAKHGSSNKFVPNIFRNVSEENKGAHCKDHKPKVLSKRSSNFHFTPWTGNQRAKSPNEVTAFTHRLGNISSPNGDRLKKYMEERNKVLPESESSPKLSVARGGRNLGTLFNDLVKNICERYKVKDTREMMHQGDGLNRSKVSLKRKMQNLNFSIKDAPPSYPISRNERLNLDVSCSRKTSVLKEVSRKMSVARQPSPCFDIQIDYEKNEANEQSVAVSKYSERASENPAKSGWRGSNKNSSPQSPDGMSRSLLHGMGDYGERLSEKGAPAFILANQLTIPRSKAPSLSQKIDLYEGEIDELENQCSEKYEALVQENPEIIILSDIIKGYFHKDSLAEDFKTDLSFYQIGKCIGKGSFGKVYFGIQLLTGLEVAIKMIHKKSLAKDANSKFKIENEIALLLKARSSPRVIKLLEVFEDEETFYIVMEKAGQGDLLSYLRAQGVMPERKAKDIIIDIVHGLMDIHKIGIIHRDIKLDNILLMNNFGAKLADFGISKQLGRNEILRDQCGTPAYLSPEMILNKGMDGYSSDVWSLGILLHAIVLGRVPFKSEQLNDLYQKIVDSPFVLPQKPATSEEFKDLVHLLLQKNPNSRIRLPDILNHEWLGDHLKTKEKIKIVNTQEKNKLLAEFLLERLGFPSGYLRKSVHENAANHATACYMNLLSSLCDE
jgi:serine/threonine protein kinase